MNDLSIQAHAIINNSKIPNLAPSKNSKKNSSFFSEMKNHIFWARENFLFFYKWEIQFGEIVKSRPVWADEYFKCGGSRE